MGITEKCSKCGTTKNVATVLGQFVCIPCFDEMLACAKKTVVQECPGSVAHEEALSKYEHLLALAITK